MSNKTLLCRTASIFGLALSLIAAAQAPAAEVAEATEAAVADDAEIQRASDIVVLAEIGYRNRTDKTTPTLVYDTTYFQRFEPLTAGDVLKRIPSVTFLSDVIESDGARLRGRALP